VEAFISVGITFFSISENDIIFYFIFLKFGGWGDDFFQGRTLVVRDRGIFLSFRNFIVFET